MLYAIGACLVIAAFIWPSSKKISILMLIFMWVLFAFNTGNSDYIAYERIYERIGNGNFWATTVSEEGYIALCYIFYYFFKFSYAQFLIVMATFSTFLLLFITKKITVNRNIVYALFLMFPYWAMICQVRSYVAFLFGVLAFYYLFSRDDKKGVFLFVLYTVLGGLFHRTALFFLPFVLIRKLSLKLISIATCVFAFAMILIRTPVMINIITNLTSMRKIENWLLSESQRSVLGVIILLIVRATLVAIELYFYSKAKNYNKVGALAYSEEILKVTIYSMAILTLEIYTPEYERIFRLPMFLAYCLFADYSRGRIVNIRKMPVLYLIFLAFFIVFVIYFFAGFPTWFEGTFRAMFENNILLN